MKAITIPDKLRTLEEFVQDWQQFPTLNHVFRTHIFEKQDLKKEIMNANCLHSESASPSSAFRTIFTHHAQRPA